MDITFRGQLETNPAHWPRKKVKTYDNKNFNKDKVRDHIWMESRGVDFKPRHYRCQNET